MANFSMNGKSPNLHDDVFIAHDANLIGDITIGAGSSVWFNTTLRADLNSITVGENTNIQDNCIVHVDTGFPTTIGSFVTIGHRAIIHGCTIGDRCLIGMGCIIMDGAEIGDECIIGAGALIPEGKKIPPRSVVMGMPGKIIKEVTAEQIAHFVRAAENYAVLAQKYKKEQ